MNQIIRIILMIGVLVLAVLLLLYVFGFLALPDLLAYLKVAAIALIIVAAASAAIVMLSNTGPRDN